MESKDTVVVVAPAGPTREAIETFVRNKGRKVVSLRREEFPRCPQVVIEQSRLLFDDVDVLSRAHAAIVIDSGMMWPLPMLDPTPEQWEQHREDFDTYLRDERETSSFWFSCLDILNDGIERCINPQGAFALAATKLDALDALREAGVPVAPLICTNDGHALEEFLVEHRGSWVELSLSGKAPTAVEAEALRARDLEVAPVLVQAGEASAIERITSVRGVAQAGDPDAVEGFSAFLEEAHRVLEAPWLDLWLRSDGKGWVLSDFSPAPRLDSLDDAQRERVLEAVWQWLDGGAVR